MTFDVSGAPIDDVKDIVGRGLQEHGFSVAKSVPARRGERITFKDPGGQQVDVLFRGKDNVKVGLPDGTGQIYVHWHQPAN